MDISDILARPHRMKPGRATPFLEGFANRTGVGRPQCLDDQRLLRPPLIHFGTWLKSRDLHFADISEETIKAFATHRCLCPGTHKPQRISRVYTACAQRFAEYLQQQGVIRATANAEIKARSPLSEFRDWLLRHRGLATVTVARHERLIMQMLPSLGSNTAPYSAASVRSVILDQIRGRRPADAKTFVGALRVYLRFLATNSACQPGLDHMLPTVAEWKLSSLPRYLDANQAACLIDSCSKDGPQGLRDRAIILLLLRLGLRAGDIANMRSGDIDWQDGTLLVRGKGRRDVRLPLPQDAGDAVLDYIEMRVHKSPSTASFSV